ncbi:hypothetical protein [Sphingomonas arenae]|uniref:hypothetical protein n=1 Tax=Sphingomonas arenae TaxID=2812555 RepID=UPI0019689AE5|nr:hypothetical protein [Sphingomonas arenae]
MHFSEVNGYPLQVIDRHDLLRLFGRYASHDQRPIVRILYLDDTGGVLQLEEVEPPIFMQGHELGEGIACKAFDIGAESVLLFRTDQSSTAPQVHDWVLADAVAKYAPEAAITFMDYCLISPLEAYSLTSRKLLENR